MITNTKIQEFLLDFSLPDENLFSLCEALSLVKEPWKAEIGRFGLFLLDENRQTFTFHTSGTTGTPKSMEFSKTQILASAAVTNRYFGLKPGSRLLLCLPAQYVAGRMMMARAREGKLLLVCREPSLNPLLQEDFDFSALTPAQAATILENQGEKALHHLNTLIIGGGELPSLLEEKLRQQPQHIFATYGMTETLSHVAVRQIAPSHREDFHAVSPDYHFETDSESRLIIRLPGQEALHTNDIVTLTGPQAFRWLGRYDFVINSGGIKIHPEALEKTLAASGLIGFPFYITGVSDPVFGSVPVLVIESEPQEMDLEAINALLPRQQRIRTIYFRKPFSRTGSGKIRRENLG